MWATQVIKRVEPPPPVSGQQPPGPRSPPLLAPGSRLLYSPHMSRDLLIGLAFFALMGIGGGLLVWLNRHRISVDEMRKDQRSQVALLARHLGVARTQLQAARGTDDPARRTDLARQALNAYNAAIGLKDDEALIWSERAETQLLLGDKPAARRDLDRAKQLQPGGDWAAIERQLTP
jgi:hypothetical protein